MGRIRTTQKQLAPQDQFLDATRNTKIQMSLVGMADRYDEQARDHIVATYNNPKLMEAYRQVRNSSIYDKGGKNYRKIFELPDMIVWDFVNTTLTALYGPDWLKNNRAVRHELVKPFWVVNKL